MAMWIITVASEAKAIAMGNKPRGVRNSACP